MSLEAHVRITNPTGLHARPAVKLAKLAAGYQADVEVRVGDDGGWVRARSTAKLMKLKAGANATLHFRAVGDEASDALNALVDFVRRDFDEGPGTDGDAHAQPGAEHAVGVPQNGAGRGIIRGAVASTGLATGHIHVLAESVRSDRCAGTPDEERAALEQALGAAVAKLQTLAAGADSVASEVIAFQISMLCDQELTAPVLEAIAAGTAADQAWDLHLSREIADYESAEEGYFRDRAADLRDLHERVARALTNAEGEALDLPAQAIVVADELTPSRFLELAAARLAGIATREGSVAGHVAMLARSRQLPYIVKLGADPLTLNDGDEAILDAEQGFLLLSPDAVTRREYEEHLQARREKARADNDFLDKPAQRADGTRIETYINVDDPALLKDVNPAHCSGIGLTRTEFLFQGRSSLPDEELQCAVYRRLLTWARGRPVTIRTLDAGGDKPIAGLTLEGERNPFLGLRGLRLSLARPEVFRVQIRALLRAAAHGPLKILLPMVTLPAELEQVRAILDEELVALARIGARTARPQLGIMVEVPATALSIEQFDADFYSIGTNDLTQYVMAASRDSTQTTALLDPLHPGVMSLIERVASYGESRGVEVSVCGEMAAMPECIPALLSAGILALSVPPGMLAATKATIGIA